jgi:hypothetical protein
MGPDGAVSCYIIVGSSRHSLRAGGIDLPNNMMSLSALRLRSRYRRTELKKTFPANVSGRHFLAFFTLALLPVSALAQDALIVTVTTDKQTYDQGQFVLITVEVLKSGTPAAYTTVYYQIRDPAGQPISSGFIITDSTGHYTKQIMIGNDFPLGSYEVYVSVTIGDESASATADFQTVPEFNSSLALLSAFVAAVGVLTAFGKKRILR